jgi:hypothetical protein
VKAESPGRAPVYAFQGVIGGEQSLQPGLVACVGGALHP